MLIEYGIELDVIHHTQIINNLLEQGRLQLNGAGDLGKVLFHDSCYLGRHNDIYEAPRHVVATSIGQAPAEMDRNHNNGFCCGAGGGRMWMEDRVGKRIDMARVEEAIRKDPQTIAVCCPYCTTMLEDGLKDENAEDRVQVLDVAEIVARALK